MTDTTITILGGGPAGLTCGLFLAKENIPFTILEKSFYPRDKICGDAISGSSLYVMRRLFPEFPAELQDLPKTFPSRGINFFAPNGKMLKIPYMPSKPQATAPGFTVRRSDFDHFLARKLKEMMPHSLTEGFEVKKIEKTQEGFRLDDGSRNIDTRLLIVADGAHSTFIRIFRPNTLGKKHFSAGLRQYYTNVEGMSGSHFIELHFLKDLLPGYFWIFPLTENSANVGLGVRSDVVSRKKMNLNKLLQHIITEHPGIKERFRQAIPQESPRGFGLPLSSPKTGYSGDGYLLTGDAGHLIDPFSGEGIGNAMLSGMLAAGIAVRAREEMNFSKAFLSQYDQELNGKLSNELSVSASLQALAFYPGLFNFVVNKALKNKTLRDTFSAMLNQADLRKQFQNPLFYLKLLTNKDF